MSVSKTAIECILNTTRSMILLLLSAQAFLRHIYTFCEILLVISEVEG